MAFCEQNDVDYIFALAGTKPLARKVDEVSDAVRTERAVENKAVVRRYTEARHAAGSWHCERRVIARIEATEQGLDIRYVVTSLRIGSAEWVYDSLYCASRQAENLIKLHKTQLASDRTSCRSALANQVRLFSHHFDLPAPGTPAAPQQRAGVSSECLCPRDAASRRPSAPAVWSRNYQICQAHHMRKVRHSWPPTCTGRYTRSPPPDCCHRPRTPRYLG